ncbi:hypothetical protein NBRC110019_06820 [Neptunitalea chrysea]|uniref:CAAX prenyl protease 2/Lysostaphin resistance protein A-like domain-containing protein n=1 Tax=Neptunitalea chrysea TaxID=1647581 RepID=A0A9W6B6J9_9FLAO|nr:type II CAAX endopeptidase family protein [Neptunitalea chrysea]GLB51643.1 hypothetical protein NBRC110019_06820 [Neptunitalea chrysea]
MEVKSILYKTVYFPLIKIIIGAVVCIASYVLVENLFIYLLELVGIQGELKFLISGVATAIGVIVVYKYLFQFYENRKVTEISGDRFFKNIGLGVFVGVLMMSLTIGVIYVAGGYKVESVNPIWYVVPALTMAITSAIFEEILFRGVLFRVVEEKLGSYIALVISAFVFGLLHMMNPNSSLNAGISIAIEAGFLLGVAYMYTRNLWFPIAIHFAWNFTQSTIFGANVSGTQVSKTFITASIEGPEWLTGGAFGPEASIQAPIFGVILSVVLLFLCYKQGHIIKPFWKK